MGRSGAIKTNTVRIFISSPGDVAEERSLARRAIERLQREFSDQLDLRTYFWEHEPLIAAQAYQEQIPLPSQFDLFVTILWSRMGTRMHPHQAPSSGEGRTGTQFEVGNALQGWRERKKPDILIFVRTSAVAIEDIRDRAHTDERVRQQREVEDFLSAVLTDNPTIGLAAHHRYSAPWDFAQQFYAKLRRWLEARLGSETARRATWRDRPYRGLEPFEAAHQAIFFGRQRETSAILQRLRELEIPQADDTARSFLMLQGMSGNGKSSLIRAGVLPLLCVGAIGSVGVWRRAVLRPSDAGADVFKALAIALVGDAEAEEDARALPELLKAGQTIESVSQELRSLPTGAGARLRGVIADVAHDQGFSIQHVRLVVFVDQFEELFTDVRIEQDAREAFIVALDSLASATEIVVIAALRSDFAHRCEAFPVLAALRRGRVFELDPPEISSFLDMIELPASLSGVRFEQRDGASLSSRILQDAQRSPEALPLLEFVLDALYERRTADGVMTFEAYEALGGVGGALIQAAELTVCELDVAPEEGSLAFHQLMRELIGIDVNGVRTRRRVVRSIVESGPGIARLVQALERARLLSGDRNADGRPVLSLAHEALITSNWPRLHRWLEEEGELLQRRRVFQQRAQDWHAAAESDEYLLGPGQPLAHARSVAASGMHLSEHELRFLSRSIDAEESAHAAARRRDEDKQRTQLEIARLHAEKAEQSRAAEARRSRLVRRALAGVSLLALVAIAAAGYSWQLNQTARRASANALLSIAGVDYAQGNMEGAVRSARDARSFGAGMAADHLEFRASLRMSSVDVSSKTGFRWACFIDGGNRFVTFESDGTLSEYAPQSNQPVRVEHLPLGETTFDEAGCRRVLTHAEGKEIIVFDLLRWDRVRLLASQAMIDSPELDFTFSRDSRYVALSAYARNDVQTFDSHSGLPASPRYEWLNGSTPAVEGHSLMPQVVIRGSTLLMESRIGSLAPTLLEAADGQARKWPVQRLGPILYTPDPCRLLADDLDGSLWAGKVCGETDESWSGPRWERFQDADSFFGDSQVFGDALWALDGRTLRRRSLSTYDDRRLTVSASPRAFALSPGGEMVAYQDYRGGRLRIIRAKDGEEIGSVASHGMPAAIRLGWSADSGTLFSTDARSTRRWNTYDIAVRAGVGVRALDSTILQDKKVLIDNGKQSCRLEHDDWDIVRAVFSATRRRAVVFVQQLDPPRFTGHLILDMDDCRIKDRSESTEDRRYAVQQEGADAKHFSFVEAGKLHILSVENGQPVVAPLSLAHNKAFRISAEGTHAILIDRDSVSVFDVGQGRVVFESPKGTQNISDGAMLDAHIVAVFRADGRIQLTSLKDPAWHRELMGPQDAQLAGVVPELGYLVVFGTRNRMSSVLVFSLKTMAEVADELVLEREISPRVPEISFDAVNSTLKVDGVALRLPTHARCDAIDECSTSASPAAWGVFFHELAIPFELIYSGDVEHSWSRTMLDSALRSKACTGDLEKYGNSYEQLWSCLSQYEYFDESPVLQRVADWAERQQPEVISRWRVLLADRVFVDSDGQRFRRPDDIDLSLVDEKLWAKLRTVMRREDLEVIDALKDVEVAPWFLQSELIQRAPEAKPVLQRLHDAQSDMRFNTTMKELDALASANPLLQFTAARIRYERGGDEAAALKRLLALADSGLVDAQEWWFQQPPYLLQAYLPGDGGKFGEFRDTARRWLTASPRPALKSELAHQLMWNRKNPQAHEEGLRFLREAAEEGDEWAIIQLLGQPGVLLTEAQLDTALKKISMLAKHGSPEARIVVARLCLSGHLECSRNQAISWLESAALTGRVDVAYELAGLGKDGSAVVGGRAVDSWLALAAAKGHELAILEYARNRVADASLTPDQLTAWIEILEEEFAGDYDDPVAREAFRLRNIFFARQVGTVQIDLDKIPQGPLPWERVSE